MIKRNTQTKLRKGAPNRRVDTPLRKVEETEACLTILADCDQRGTAPFRQALSAFLAAFRSAHKVLCRHDKQLYTAWEASLSAHDHWLTDMLLEARNVETYEDGPALGVTVGGSSKDSRVHHFHVKDTAGIEQTVPIVDVCAQQVSLIRNALKAVTR